MPDELPAHLISTDSARGFGHLPTIQGRALTTVRVYESSLAFEGPHLWLNVREPVDLNVASIAEQTGQEYTGGWNDATIHFHVDDAVKLAEQLRHLVDVHYHHDYPASGGGSAPD